MSNSPSFYSFCSTAQEACSIEKACHAEAHRTWLCTGCASPKPGTKELDATVQNESMEGPPLNFVFGCDLGVARKEFLFAFGENVVRHHFYLGRLSRDDGTPFDDWVTFRGKHRIFVRGSKHAQYRQCTLCGRRLYFALGKHYLYPQPPAGVTIFDTGNGGLVLTEDLVQGVTINKWRKLEFLKLPILDAPLDGLGDLPSP
jgi:hypothetical protein